MSEPFSDAPRRLDKVTGEGEVDLSELFARLWAGRWVIIASGLLASAIAIVVALSLPTRYQSTALLLPTPDEQQSMINSISGRLGGLTSIAGLDLSSSGSVPTTVLAIQLLKSRAFLTDFVRRHDLTVPLMAASGWDSDTGGWVIDPDLYDVSARSWIREVEPGKDVAPSDWDVYKVIREIVEVSTAPDTGLVTLSVELESPVAARDWAAMLIEDINEHMRAREIDEAKRSMQFLRAQAESAEVGQMKALFYGLVEQQIQRRMLAETRNEFAFKVIDPPVIPEEASFPKRKLIVLFGGLLGGLIGGFISLLWYRQRSSK